MIKLNEDNIIYIAIFLLILYFVFSSVSLSIFGPVIELEEYNGSEPGIENGYIYVNVAHENDCVLGHGIINNETVLVYAKTYQGECNESDGVKITYGPFDDKINYTILVDDGELKTYGPFESE